MASALREIFARFGVDFDDRELKKGDQSVKKITESLSKLGIIIGGAAIIRGLQNFVSETIQLGDRLDKTSQQLGLTTDQLQAYEHAAGLSGVNTQQFVVALSTLQKNAEAAGRGQKEMAKAFSTIGVNVRDSSGRLKSGDELLRAIADGIAGVEDPTQRVAIAMRVMGESGRRMLPMFANGAAGIDAMTAELAALGGGASPEMVRQSAALTDSLSRFNLAMLGVRSRLAVILLPIVNAATKAITGLSTAIFSLVDNSTVVQTTLAILGAAFVAFGIKAAAAFAGPLITFGLVAVAIAFIVLVVDDLVVTFRGGESVTREFVDALFGIGATARAVQFLKDVVGFLVLELRKAVAFARAFVDVTAPLAEATSFVGAELRGAGESGRAFRHFISPSIRAESAVRSEAEATRRERETRRRGLAAIRSMEGGIEGEIRLGEPVLGPGGRILGRGATQEFRNGRWVEIGDTNTSVTVNVQGGDPQRIASAVRREIETTLDQRNRQALAALEGRTPATEASP